MQNFLRAWRKTRKLSLEIVGAELGVAHTTVGRWEKGEVPITVEDLERLAKVYGATREQLEHPPELAEMVSFLNRARHIVSELPPEDLEKWLSLGEALRRRL